MRFSTFFVLLVLVLLIFGVRTARVTMSRVSADPPAASELQNQPPKENDDSKSAMSPKGRTKHGADAAKARSRISDLSQPVASNEVLWKAEVSAKATKPQAARQEAIENAAEKLSAYMRARFHDFKYKPTPQFLVEHKMVDEGRDEKLTLSDPEAPEMTLHTLAVELREPQLHLLLAEDRQERGTERLWQAGHLLGGLVVMLIALVGYIRLDDWTKGYLSLPLKLGALSVAIAGPVVLWWVV
jgi:hypothetical protein